MSTPYFPDTFIDNYVAQFVQLPPRDQAILLNRLRESAQKNTTVSKDIPEMYFLPKPPNAPSFEELAGSWEDERSAEEIIEDLRRSRTPNRDRVNFDEEK